MTKFEAQKLVGAKNWFKFQKFMYGQTIGVYPDGETDYYEDDVMRFVRGLPVID